MLLPRAALALLLLALTGCSTEATSLGAIEAQTAAVVVATLEPGSTGEDGARLSEEYSRFAAVAGTRADGGTQLQVFLEPKASDAEVRAVQRALEQEPGVAEVSVDRRHSTD